MGYVLRALRNLGSHVVMVHRISIPRVWHQDLSVSSALKNFERVDIMDRNTVTCLWAQCDHVRVWYVYVHSLNNDARV